MNIREAAQQSDVLGAALAYAEVGLSVLPLHGKTPPVVGGVQLGWVRRQVERASFSIIHEWARRGYLQNVGVVCGAVSNNLVVLDLDGDAAVNAFWEWAESRLPQTYSVRSGSGHGCHVYFVCDDLPTTTRTKGFELRANGCYVVAPPSVHPETGSVYQPNRCDVAQVSNLEPLREWIKGKIPRPARPERPPTATLDRTIGSDYGRRALASEIRTVSGAAEGQRNNLLNRAAYNLGQLVADGALDRVQVESALLGAALAVGLDEVPALRTIDSGLNAGLQKPRSEMFRVRGKRS